MSDKNLYKEGGLVKNILKDDEIAVSLTPAVVLYEDKDGNLVTKEFKNGEIK